MELPSQDHTRDLQRVPKEFLLFICQIIAPKSYFTRLPKLHTHDKNDSFVIVVARFRSRFFALWLVWLAGFFNKIHERVLTTVFNVITVKRLDSFKVSQHLPTILFKPNEKESFFSFFFQISHLDMVNKAVCYLATNHKKVTLARNRYRVAITPSLRDRLVPVQSPTDSTMAMITAIVQSHLPVVSVLYYYEGQHFETNGIHMA